MATSPRRAGECDSAGRAVARAAGPGAVDGAIAAGRNEPGARRPRTPPSNWRRSTPTWATRPAWGPSPPHSSPAFPIARTLGSARATALFLTGAVDEAIAAARALLETNPRSARVQNLLGAACATAGQTSCARAAFAAALEANPRDATTYVNLGSLNLQSANAADAVENFAEALSIDPASARAREGLAQARAALDTKP